MTDRNRGVSLQQQTGHRPPDDLAAADHAGVRAGNFDLVAIQQLYDSRGRARNEPGTTHRQKTYVRGMKPINVLSRIHGFQNRSFVNLFWQR